MTWIADGVQSPRIVRSADGRAAGWIGVVVDDLWEQGCPLNRWPRFETLVPAGVPSDSYLMTGCERKTLALRHDRPASVVTHGHVVIEGHAKVDDPEAAIAIQPEHLREPQRADFIGLSLVCPWAQVKRTGRRAKRPAAQTGARRGPVGPDPWHPIFTAGTPAPAPPGGLRSAAWRAS